LRSAKLCAVHNAQSGPLTGGKKSLRRCGFTGSAAYILRLKNTSFGCRQLINKTQLRSAAAPALSSSVAVAVCLTLPWRCTLLAVRGCRCSLVVAPAVVVVVLLSS
jgi:hypothetical protein